MGGAEGTKLDLDFMEMERVSNYSDGRFIKVTCGDVHFLTFLNDFWTTTENRRDGRAGGGVADKNERVPAAESDSTGQDGGRQGNLEAVGTGQEQYIPAARGSPRRLYADVRQEVGRGQYLW